MGCCVVGSTATFASIAIFGNDPTSNVGELDFQNPLAIPPQLEPEIDESGRKTWNLTLQTGETQILQDGVATTWGVNGPFLAPTLRAVRGDEVAITLNNELPEDTGIHWHGMHLPAVMDGGPHQTIPVGESWNPTWTIDQPASTLWYHPHPHGKTAEHVYRGVSGLFLIDDERSISLDIPREYGVDDVPLIIQDKAFTGDGGFDLSPGSFLDTFSGSESFGIRGDKIIVNGTYDPVFEVKRSLTRFRLLNGSNTRFYNLGFSDDRPFRLIATDNGFIPGEMPELTRLLLGPGERAEIVVEFAEGDDVIFHSFTQGAVGSGVEGRQIGAEDTFDIIKFRASGPLETSPPLPGILVEEEEPPQAPDNATLRSFTLNGHGSINGEEMDMTRIDLVIPAGALEMWEVESNGQPHTFHIHGATYHVLDVNGAEPPPHLRGPKDTVLVSRDHPVRLLVQFDTYTDPSMPYMYHCHILRHEDNGMMGQFVVVEPGMEDVTPRMIDGGHSNH